MRRLLLTAFFLAALPMTAAGDEYSDPTGFSFTYPDGWFAVTELNKDALPPDLNKWMEKHRLDLTRIKVYLLRQADDGSFENVNVVVERQQMPINKDSMQKLLDMLPQHFQSIGASIENMQGRFGQFGDNQAIVLEFQSKLPGVPFVNKQQQVFFAGGGKTYIVTCTAPADTFDQHVETFNAILASFKVPPPTWQMPGWLRAAVIGAVVGTVVGIIAVLIALVGKWIGRKKLKSADGGLPEDSTR